MGVATSLIQRYLPARAPGRPRSSTPALHRHCPVLIYSLFRGGRVGETEGWGGALDRAITPQGESRLAGSTSSLVETASLGFFGKYAGPMLLIAIVAALPLILSGLLGRPHGSGLCLRHHLLVVDHVTGEGGMLWLCQITFAGIGACTTAELANHYGWPVLAAVRHRRSRRRGHRSARRISQHPARRPLRGARHA